VLITGTPGTGKTTLAALIVERLNQEAEEERSAQENDDAATATTTRIIAKHINVGEIIQTHQFYDGYDTELQSYILEEDPLIDYLDEIFIETVHKNDPHDHHNDDHNDHDDLDENYDVSLITDYHLCEIFPERYFDLVLVLRTNTEVLYDRYVARNYHTHHCNDHPDTTANGTTRSTIPNTTGAANTNNVAPTTNATSTTSTSSAKITQNIQCEIMNIIYEQARESYASEIVVELPSNTIQDMESNVQRVLQWIQLYMTTKT
jgi:adenylate kinase